MAATLYNPLLFDHSYDSFVVTNFAKSRPFMDGILSSFNFNDFIS